MLPVRMLIYFKTSTAQVLPMRLHFTSHVLSPGLLLHNNLPSLVRYWVSRYIDFVSPPALPHINMQPFSQQKFTVRDILRHEAEALSNHSPSRSECRNESLLLDEPICSPARWEVEEEYRGSFKSLLGPIDYSYMECVLKDDDEGFLVVLHNILHRVTLIAFVCVS